MRCGGFLRCGGQGELCFGLLDCCLGRNDRMTTTGRYEDRIICSWQRNCRKSKCSKTLNIGDGRVSEASERSSQAKGPARARAKAIARAGSLARGPRDTPSLSRRRAQATYRCLFRCTSVATVRCNQRTTRWSETAGNVHSLEQFRGGSER